MLDALDAHDVRVADALEPHDHKLDVIFCDPLAQRHQVAVQFRCGAEE